MDRLYKISWFIWLLATVFYAAGVLGVLGQYYFATKVSPINDLVTLLFFLFYLIVGVTAARLLSLTHLPIPVLLIFGGGNGSHPGTGSADLFTLSIHLAWTGGYLWFIGLVGVTLSIIALKNIRKQRSWARVFIGLSLLAYLLSIVDALTGVCTGIDWDSKGSFVAYCRFGMLAAWPNFLASTVLLAAAIVINKFRREPHAVPHR